MVGGHHCHQLSPPRAFQWTLPWPTTFTEHALTSCVSGLKINGARPCSWRLTVSWWREHTRIRYSHAVASAVIEAQRVVGEGGWQRLISPRLIVPDPDHQFSAYKNLFHPGF